MDTSTNTYYVIQRPDTGQFFWMNRYESGWNDHGTGFTKLEIIRLTHDGEILGEPVVALKRTVITKTAHDTTEELREEIEAYHALMGRVRAWKDEVQAQNPGERISWSSSGDAVNLRALIYNKDRSLREEIWFDETRIR